MTADVTIAGARLTAHPLRAAVLGEVHARPFTPIETPRRVLHFAFETTAERGEADRAALVVVLRRRARLRRAAAGRQASSRGVRRDRAALGAAFGIHHLHLGASVRAPARAPFHPPAATLAGPMGLVPQPGPGAGRDRPASARRTSAIAPERLFDRASLAAAENSDGTALYATDFQQRSSRLRAHPDRRPRARAGARGRADPARAGDRDLSHARAARAARGAAARPSVRRIETRLAEVTAATRGAQGLGGEPAPARRADRACRRA